MHRHAADDPDIATILTTAHDIHRVTVAFSAGRISTAHATAAARANLAVLRQNALMTATRSDPPPCADPERASPPARVSAVDPSTPTTRLDAP